MLKFNSKDFVFACLLVAAKAEEYANPAVINAVYLKYASEVEAKECRDIRSEVSGCTVLYCTVLYCTASGMDTGMDARRNVVPEKRERGEA